MGRDEDPKSWEKKYVFLEMEYVKHPGISTQEMTPAELFEYCHGNWAGLFYSNLIVLDDTFRNRGFTTVSYYRAYHFKGNIYLIPPSERLPKKYDYGNVGDTSEASFHGYSKEDFESMCHSELAAIESFRVDSIPEGIEVQNFFIEN